MWSVSIESARTLRRLTDVRAAPTDRTGRVGPGCLRDLHATELGSPALDLDPGRRWTFRRGRSCPGFGAAMPGCCSLGVTYPTERRSAGLQPNRRGSNKRHSLRQSVIDCCCTSYNGVEWRWRDSNDVKPDTITPRQRHCANSSCKDDRGGVGPGGTRRHSLACAAIAGSVSHRCPTV
jgi:hypothetical protein